MRLEKTLYVIENPLVYATGEEQNKLKKSYQNTINKVARDPSSFLFIHFDLPLENFRSNPIYKKAKTLKAKCLTTAEEIENMPIIAKVVVQGEYWVDALGVGVDICNEYGIKPENFNVDLNGSLLEKNLELFEQKFALAMKSLTRNSLDYELWLKRIDAILEEQLH
ncbi:MAG: hypothetical protein QXQ79_00565 [Candidatus Nanoarchaeia archaeon]